MDLGGPRVGTPQTFMPASPSPVPFPGLRGHERSQGDTWPVHTGDVKCFRSQPCKCELRHQGRVDLGPLPGG